MVDMTLITGALSTLKSAVDIGCAVKEIDDLTTVQDKVIEVQGLILSAQSSAMAAQAQLWEVLEENRELQAKADQIDAWAQTAARYRLLDYGLWIRHLCLRA